MGRAQSIFAEVANLLERYGLDLALSHRRQQFIEQLGFELLDDADENSADEQSFVRWVGAARYRLVYSQAILMDGSSLENLTFDLEHSVGTRILERASFNWIVPVAAY